MKKSKTDKALSYAYRLLNIRPRSEKELRDRLHRKGFGQTTVNDIIPLLKEKNVIDDYRFAKLWIESRMRRIPKGGILLRRELREKGVSLSVIDKALSEEEIDEASLARDLAEKKFKTLKGLPKEKVKKKLFDFLARRGINFDTINDIITEFTQ